MRQHKVNLFFLAALLISILSGCGGATSGSEPGSTVEGSQAKLLSISITPSDPLIARDTTQQLTATGIYSDNTTTDLSASVIWSTSDSNIAVIDTASAAGSSSLVSASLNRGVAHAYGKNSGSTTITATAGDATGSTTITVTNATLVSLAITPTNPSIALATSQQFTATGTFSDNTTQDLTTQATWNSSNTAAVTINPSGLASSVSTGSATVTAASGSISGSTVLTVTPAVATTGSATLAWNAPLTNTNGTPLTDLAGFKIYYGTSSGNYTSVIDAGNVTQYAFTNLSPGTYYFAVTAYDTSGIESANSNEANKVIQ